MTIWVVSLWGILTCALAVAAAMRPGQGKLSRYELKRRAEAADHDAQSELRRYQQQAGLLGLVRMGQLLLAIGVFYGVMSASGLGVAVAASLATLLLAPALARWSVMERLGRRLYHRLELRADTLNRRLSWLIWLVRTEPVVPPQLQLGSREELAHFIDQAGTHLGDTERQLLLHSLAFEQRTVREVMTLADRLTTIDRHELLGPLVLDDLHKTGHSFFPVTDGPQGAIVGVLGIDGFLTLDNKRSMTADKAMTPHLVYVRDTASLRTAIKLFLQSHQHLLIVEDEQGEVVGVVTLHDCLTLLFGR